MHFAANYSILQWKSTKAGWDTGAHAAFWRGFGRGRLDPARSAGRARAARSVSADAGPAGMLERAVGASRHGQDWVRLVKAGRHLGLVQSGSFAREYGVEC